jgi:hypothetical protein
MIIKSLRAKDTVIYLSTITDRKPHNLITETSEHHSLITEPESIGNVVKEVCMLHSLALPALGDASLKPDCSSERRRVQQEFYAVT